MTVVRPNPVTQFEKLASVPDKHTRLISNCGSLRTKQKCFFSFTSFSIFSIFLFLVFLCLSLEAMKMTEGLVGKAQEAAKPTK